MPGSGRARRKGQVRSGGRREASPGIRIVLASLAAALAIFAWGFFYWTVVMPAPRLFGEPVDEAALSEALVTYLPESGTYFIPGGAAGGQTLTDRLATGPVATLFFRRHGIDAGSPLPLLYGYLQTALACLLIAILLYRCASALPSYGSRIGVVLLAGLGGTVLVTLAGPIWWHQPWRFHLIQLVYAAVAWLLAGFVLGGLIKKGRLRF